MNKSENALLFIILAAMALVLYSVPSMGIDKNLILPSFSVESH